MNTSRDLKCLQVQLSITKRLSIASIGLFTVWNLGEGTPGSLAGEENLSGRAQQIASGNTGVPTAELKIARMSPLADTGVTQFKLVDSRGNISGVDLDASGNQIGANALAQLTKRLEDSGSVGKFEPELASLLGGARADSPLNVVFELKDPAIASIRGEQVQPEQYRAGLQGIREQIAAAAKPVVDELRARGERIIYQAQYAPMVVVSAVPSEIQLMASRAAVEKVYLERVAQPRLNVSRQVVQADRVNSKGITGAGRRVAVVEANRIGTHPNLPAAQRILIRPGASAVVSGHKTNVAGVIQSSNASVRGMAPAITILDGIGANFSDGEMMAATDAVIAAGADAINMSFGSETNGSFDAFARYIDRTVYNTGKTICVAVSNFCANRMGSPEIAFNVLAVGAFGDNNTVGFGDDIPACTGAVNFSAFLNPLSPHNDRQEPDIVAPGHNIFTTTSAGTFANATGTSFAAPHVTGGVGLLVQRKPSLSTRVEEVRANMMASARHNLEGASRLSDRDGAGGIMLAAADEVALDTESKFVVNPGGSAGFPINNSFTATAGQRVRVAIAWSHKPAGATLTQPTTDLDLSVLRPGGASVGASASFDNSYEIVEFVAPVSGTYTTRITNYRPSPGTEFVGWAVSRTDI